MLYVFQPKSVQTTQVKQTPAVDTSQLNQEITKQGDLVRSLKSAKAEKAKVDEAVKTLLDLKAKYKTATGQVNIFISICFKLLNLSFFKSIKAYANTALLSWSS